MEVPSHILERSVELERLIAYGRSISEWTSGRTVDSRRANAGNIFAKIIAHAMTLRNAIPVHEVRPGTLIDLASACVLARVIMEAYDSMFYIALDAMTDEEQQLRVALWELHASERVLSIVEANRSSQTLIDYRRSVRDRHKAHVLAHPAFAQLHPQVRSKIAQGNCPAFHLPQAERNRRAGVDDKFYGGLEMNFSQYVHTHPHSVMAVSTFNIRDPQSLRRIGTPLSAATAFVCKAVAGMRELFSDLAPPDDEVAINIELWCDIVLKGMPEG